jgi:hypothetical protein
LRNGVAAVAKRVYDLGINWIGFEGYDLGINWIGFEGWGYLANP